MTADMRGFDREEHEKVPCDYPDCKEEGVCKAPKDRTLREYYMFCPHHAKIYNEQWDYYAGMTPEEIEENLRLDVTWHRPTWNFSGRYSIKDPLNILNGFNFNTAARKESAPVVDEKELQALGVLNLEYPITLAKIKSRYRELAKKYHPDKTGGNKEMERIFKKLTEAYNYLQKKYSKKHAE